MQDVTFYWLPNCSTCKKAKSFLDRRGIGDLNPRDIKANPLDRREVEALAQMAGGGGEIFSRRAVKYREMKLNERELSDSEMFDLMAGEYTFLKRPVLVCRGGAIAGFTDKSWDLWLAENYNK